MLKGYKTQLTLEMAPLRMHSQGKGVPGALL